MGDLRHAAREFILASPSVVVFVEVIHACTIAALHVQIVKMNDSMTMMFEAEDLEQASPATVSRVGMIFCEIRNLDWQPLRSVWLNSLPVTFEEHRSLVVGLFDWLFPAALYFVQKQCVIPTPVTGQVC